MKTVEQVIEVGGKKLILEYGRFAEQANSAILATYGETVVHVTTTMSSRDTDLNYFPLSVEYQEKLYAGGKIKGSRWVKRDGKPSDDAILKARVIDRSIRPLFPKHVKRDVQVIVTILSSDGENNADMPALVATSAALHTSDIPWDGPVAAVRVGKDKQFQINPTHEQLENSILDLVVSGTKEAIVMVEAGAKEAPEKDIIEALKLAHSEIQKIVEGIEQLQSKIGKTKQVFELPESLAAELISKIEKDALPQLQPLVGKEHDNKGMTGEIISALADKYEDEVSTKEIDIVVSDLYRKLARKSTIEKGIRADGRKPEDIREISSEVGILPRTHGSAMFKRGQTQALTITTLGPPSLGQLIESMDGEETKNYIHHYNFPPSSVGETGRVGWPSRREIGHGALAERALIPVLPSEEEFPYTIHVVSEIMSSNGSTSQASICGSTLSLMDAGVPIKKPVSGIAMGLMTDGNKHVVLSDIAGVEDHIGDMDFKVAGTRDGITALQMDIKVKGISFEILETALEQAKVGRLHIMDKMLVALDKPRTSMSKYAPKIEQFEIPKDAIGEVIGPGGKMIKQIIEETGAEINVNDDTGVGVVTVSSSDQDAIDKAKSWIQNMVKVPQPGEVYEGIVKRVEQYGAFVEILPGKSGLVHVSRMSKDFIKNPSDVVKEGDTVSVTVTEVDQQGRLNLSMV